MVACLKELKALSVYVLGVIFGGALGAPWLYHITQYLLRFEFFSWFLWLHVFAFEKYFNRAVLVLALLGIRPLLKRLKIAGWADLGLQKNPRFWHDAFLGVCLALLGVGSFALLLHALQWRIWQHSPDVSQLGLALGTAIVVSFLEELLFRGLLFGVLRRHLPTWPSSVGLALFFAALHFMKSNPSFVSTKQIHWDSGLFLVPQLFWQFAKPWQLLQDGGLMMICVGLILSYTVVQTASLAWAIGLHGGWIFAMKILSAATYVPVDHPSLWVGEDVRSGLSAVCLMGATFLGVVIALPSRKPNFKG